MNAVFLDTVGLLALWDQSDQWHAAATHAFTLLSDARRTLVTSPYVLLECGNAAARRPYRPAVDRLRRELSGAGLLLLPTEEEWVRAWEAYARGAAHDAGIVDHTSFLLMRRHEIHEAFTNDRHFAREGFRILF